MRLQLASDWNLRAAVLARARRLQVSWIVSAVLGPFFAAAAIAIVSVLAPDAYLASVAISTIICLWAFAAAAGRYSRLSLLLERVANIPLRAVAGSGR